MKQRNTCLIYAQRQARCLLNLLLLLIPGKFSIAQWQVSDIKKPGDFNLGASSICVDSNDYKLVGHAARLLQQDLLMVTGKQSVLVNGLKTGSKSVIIIGTIEKSSIIKMLIEQKIINPGYIRHKWEAYLVQTVKNPFPGIEQALVIAGSDRRGTAYGVFDLSRQIGVSPWNWWADVPVSRKNELFIHSPLLISDSPKVKYRGIFINDEAPALSNWSREKFGGFKHGFYQKVFELMLRLKANYLWPAMWGNAFYDDDSVNIRMADEYGIVIGTSHHEPLMRAHDEWRRYGKGKWNYDSNQASLQQFWEGGMRRAWNEKIVSIGMRGDGDEPMTRETATALLERIVVDQRKIISSVTGKPANQTPQLWALYKEVQDYYDKGMNVPDDVTLLLCDDNWGNIRKLPAPGMPQRSGGYGIYYHFDYVGGPRNYKWLNTNPLPRIWEQMNLAWVYGARQIWIVNVGDIKPMELPISFFLDFAWNPQRIGAIHLKDYTRQWAAAQFGNKHSKAIADILSKYSKYNSRRKPELLDHSTYSLVNYQEFENVVKDYNTLLSVTISIGEQLPLAYRDAYFQLLLHPVKACANLNEMYYNIALNKYAFEKKNAAANKFADRVKELYLNDSLITLEYHRLNKGKWNHMMSQTHIGYTYWQQPPYNKMPDLKYISAETVVEKTSLSLSTEKFTNNPLPKKEKGMLYYEYEKYISIDASRYSKAVNSATARWQILPDHGRTGSAITTLPFGKQMPENLFPCAEYAFYTSSSGSFKLQAYFSPTLNFHNSASGLQYSVSVDKDARQAISVNKEEKNVRTWEKWVAENIIIKTSEHNLHKAGKHVIKYCPLQPGLVLQKLVLDFGGVKETYLGPPETVRK